MAKNIVFYIKYEPVASRNEDHRRTTKTLFLHATAR
jgi:hypothetical protein